MEYPSPSHDLCSEDMFYTHIRLEYYAFTIQQLEKERQCICRRGAMSPQQDRRIDEIEAELLYWAELQAEALTESLEEK